MAHHVFLQKDSIARFKKAVAAVEDESAAEIVVSVAPWAGSYRWVDLAVGSVLSLGALVFMLFSDMVFSWITIAANTVIVYAVGALVINIATPLRLGLAGRKYVQRAVSTLAAARFHELGVANTRDRSGILVFVALLEKRCVVLADAGVKDAVGEKQWRIMAETVENAVRTAGVGKKGVEALAQAIETLGPQLSRSLVRKEDDINELPDFAEG